MFEREHRPTDANGDEEEHQRKSESDPHQGRQPPANASRAADRGQQHVVRPGRHARNEGEDRETDELLERHAPP